VTAAPPSHQRAITPTRPGRGFTHSASAVAAMALNLVVREYLKKMLMEAGSGMKVLLVDQDTVRTRPPSLPRSRSHQEPTSEPCGRVMERPLLLRSRSTATWPVGRVGIRTKGLARSLGAVQP